MTNPITVLVVEDEPLIRMELAGELEDRGFAVLEAGSSREAIQRLLHHPEIQILFTEIDMPGDMDGLMLAAAVRDRWPPIKIIVTSSRHFVKVDDIAAEIRFLPKPHRPDVVAAAMRELIG